MPKLPRRSSPLHHPGPWDLTASEAFYQLAFEQSPMPMWVVDATGLALIAVNDAAVRTSGYTRSEFLDLKVPALCSSEEIAAIVTAPPEPIDRASTHKGGSAAKTSVSWRCT